MKVYVNEITGVADACVSLLMSKRSWSREKEMNIRNFFREHLTAEGQFKPTTEASKAIWNTHMQQLYKWGVQHRHVTLLRYINVSITIEGMHRAGQDDMDAHAARMNNRIVRASSRLGVFKDGEVSDYYKDKIMFPFQAAEALGIEFPTTFSTPKVDNVDNVNNEVDNEEPVDVWDKTDYGYVNRKERDNQDAKRGLYPLAIPSTFTFSIQLPELAHIYQLRGANDGHANPEVIECAELIRDNLALLVPEFATWLPEVRTDKAYSEV